MTEILTIVGNNTDAQKIKTILSDPALSCTVKNASSISLAVQSVEQNPPDLIILDMPMSLPEIDILFMKIKENQELFVPVIWIATPQDKEALADALKRGVLDFIVKPFDPEEIKTRVVIQLNFKKKYDATWWVAQKSDESIKLLYKELERKNKELKKLDNLKSEFVSTVSHELRTPLTMMMEFAAIILDEIPGKLNTKQQEYMQIIRDNVERLTRLINDLLNISRIESGEIKLEKKMTNITELITKILSNFMIKTEKRRIKLENLSTDASVEAIIDPDKIVEVFTNLVGNAIKFTPDGGKITVELKDGENEIKCRVTNTGEGIPASHLERVFDRFHQVGRDSGSGAKGTGLGLAISKELVAMHHGKIWVESKEGEETSFIFTLRKT